MGLLVEIHISKVLSQIGINPKKQTRGSLMLKSLFINPSQRLLRAGWRIFLFLILLFAIAKSLQLTIGNMFGGFPDDKTLKFFFLILLASFSGTTAVIIARCYLDKKTFFSFGLTMDELAIKDWKTSKLYGKL